MVYLANSYSILEKKKTHTMECFTRRAGGGYDISVWIDEGGGVGFEVTLEQGGEGEMVWGASLDEAALAELTRAGGYRRNAEEFLDVLQSAETTAVDVCSYQEIQARTALQPIQPNTSTPHSPKKHSNKRYLLVDYQASFGRALYTLKLQPTVAAHETKEAKEIAKLRAECAELRAINRTLLLRAKEDQALGESQRKKEKKMVQTISVLKKELSDVHLELTKEREKRIGYGTPLRRGSGRGVSREPRTPRTPVRGTAGARTRSASADSVASRASRNSRGTTSRYSYNRVSSRSPSLEAAVRGAARRTPTYRTPPKRSSSREQGRRLSRQGGGSGGGGARRSRGVDSDSGSCASGGSRYGRGYSPSVRSNSSVGSVPRTARPPSGPRRWR